MIVLQMNDSSMNSNSSTCLDWQNNVIPVGAQFSPSSDACQSCTCGDGGLPTQCLSVLCKPLNAIIKKIEGRCCTYECQGSAMDLQIGLRVTTIVISLCFLIVICLILLHMRRQRQRFKRLLSQQRSLIPPPVPLLPHASFDCSSESNGAQLWNMSILPPYSPPSPKTTPPPPYTPTKEMNQPVSQMYRLSGSGTAEPNNNVEDSSFITCEGQSSRSNRNSLISDHLELTENLLSHQTGQMEYTHPTTSH